MLDPPPSAILESIMLPQRLLSMLFPRKKSFHFYLRKSPPSPRVFWLCLRNEKECNHVRLPIWRQLQTTWAQFKYVSRQQQLFRAFVIKQSTCSGIKIVKNVVFCYVCSQNKYSNTWLLSDTEISLLAFNLISHQGPCINSLFTTVIPSWISFPKLALCHFLSRMLQEQTDFQYSFP